MIIDEKGTGYFHGDEVKATGKIDKTTYSIGIHEFEILEGVHKGEFIWQPAEHITQIQGTDQ